MSRKKQSVDGESPNPAEALTLQLALQEFARLNKTQSKGPLSVMLVITRQVKNKTFPIDPNQLVTQRQGQVLGLGKSAVQAILKDHGITRVLAEEGGRTSRGSMGNMFAYVAFLNRLHERGMINFQAIEQFWIAKVSDYFASQPFIIRLDPSKSLRTVVGDLLSQAQQRQGETPGSTYAGALMQHLVGAKLNLLLPEQDIKHHGFSVADAPSERYGDFLLGDVAIHVTTSPTEALIRKCEENLGAGLRPIIVTTQMGIAGAELLATNAGVKERIDFFEIKQFISMNIYEFSFARTDDRRVVVSQGVEQYNRIVEICETDPSLKIALSGSQDS